jgi:hypothetical protein
VSQDTSLKKSDGNVAVVADSLILNDTNSNELSAVAAIKLIIEALDQRPLTYGCVADIFGIVEPFREH